MKTVVCNSAQSFIDMAENDFLSGLDVHCVFPVNDSVKKMILHCQKRHQIRNITFSKAVSAA